jgi:hypothetical protein
MKEVKEKTHSELKKKAFKRPGVKAAYAEMLIR